MSYDVPFDEDELSIAYVEIIDALSDEEAEAIVMRVAGGDPSCAAEARCILKLAAREGDLLHPDNARDVRIALLEHAVRQFAADRSASTGTASSAGLALLDAVKDAAKGAGWGWNDPLYEFIERLGKEAGRVGDLQDSVRNIEERFHALTTKHRALVGECEELRAKLAESAALERENAALIERLHRCESENAKLVDARAQSEKLAEEGRRQIEKLQQEHARLLDLKQRRWAMIEERTAELAASRERNAELRRTRLYLDPMQADHLAQLLTYIKTDPSWMEMVARSRGYEPTSFHDLYTLAEPCLRIAGKAE
jgi:hypothetical protein